MRTVWTAVCVLAATALGVAQQDAKAFLKQVQQKYRNAKSWDMQIDMTVEVKMGTNSSRQQVSTALAMQRPNRIAAKVDSGGIRVREIYSDGKTVYAYNPNQKQYQKRPAPPSFEGSTALLLGEAGLLLQFLDQDLDKMPENTQFQMRGTQPMGGKQTQIVEIRQGRGDGSNLTRLFVGTQDRLVYRVEYNETRRVPTGGQGGGQSAQQVQFSTTVTATLRYRSFDKPIPASRFRFTPPKDAKELKPPQGQPTTPP